MNHNNQQILPAPTTDQKKVLDQVESFLTNDNDIFILHGYAGTGKTTFIKSLLPILQELGLNPMLMAPTPYLDLRMDLRCM